MVFVRLQGERASSEGFEDAAELSTAPETPRDGQGNPEESTEAAEGNASESTASAKVGEDGETEADGAATVVRSYDEELNLARSLIEQV